MSDLFENSSKKPSKETEYTASNIEVLEGLEPVRKRPGMYIGGTDENALHHLVTEVFDNAMDEAVAGYASRIEISLLKDNTVIIYDNGRGIPIDPHPKFPDKSALEVIFTTLHSGGKFSNDAYKTAGGLHGVGISVVNALSDYLEVEVIRERKIWRQTYSRGIAQTPLEEVGSINNKRGTIVKFHPDHEIFGKNLSFKPKKLYNLAKSKAYLFKGVEIRWSCDPELLTNSDIPSSETIQFPNGIKDYLSQTINETCLVTNEYFYGEAGLADEGAKIEWALAWHEDEGFTNSYCNTIVTPLGGTHEQGFKNAIVKSLRAFGEATGNKKASQLTSEDIFTGACLILSIFISNPQFQGQTKEKLVNVEVAKLVEGVIKDRFDHWLTLNKHIATSLLSYVLNRLEERLNRKAQKEITRKLITQRIRLPGKLTDCTRDSALGTEIFLVEGDSAGGSAKQARSRETQAILPLRGKILNVANSTADKIRGNQELTDLEIALGCGSLKNYNEENLRYEKVIIMTDADVDGAHISSLLMTYFFKFMPKLIENGHLYLAKPPLYKITHANKTYYSQDDKAKEKLVKELEKKRGQIEISRFKGLGEMTAAQLKETTMDPTKRTLIKITLPDDMSIVETSLDNLMGRKPEYRFQFIQTEALSKGAEFIENLDI
ncbi:MAG: DNA topoisomerase IV subunit B [Alphaproteobacteria bacterium]